MFVELLGSFIQMVGELCIAFTVLRVHRRVLDEHRIDGEVFEEMRFEQFLGMLGAILIITGFLIESSNVLAVFVNNIV